MNSLVSIIVPCYNQESFIDDALQSVYDQVYQNWECIVMDDGSTDRSKELIKAWVDRDSRFSYYYKENGGIVETRNLAIKRAEGQFILPLDGDDKIHSLYISEAMKVFSEMPETKLVYCNVQLFGNIERSDNSSKYSFQKMLYENQVHSAGIFRKIDFEQTRGYNQNMFDGLEDWDFWLDFLHPEDKVVKLEGYYVYYRIKDISRSTMIDKEKNERQILQIFKNHQEKYLKFFNPVRDHINHLHYKAETERLKNSIDYRIGKIITFPFRLISKGLGRIFK